MIAREEIRNVLDHPVYDGDGHKIGEAEHVFPDDMTGRPGPQGAHRGRGDRDRGIRRNSAGPPVSPAVPQRREPDRAVAPAER